jgi:thiol-disulfide isomerase/thioredoxin
MKATQKKWTALLLALAAIVAPALAAEPTLKVGDPAPKLQNGQWVQGDPVKEFQPGKPYIVEFWATWCGPCRASIPHLNDIYTKYKDKGLVVIGQDCWEQDDTLVAPFVKKMGDTMTYRVALDDKTEGKPGKMAETWMAAAGRNGIPSAFLIDTKGVIAWIGHPMELEEHEDMIDQVLAGKFDIQKAAADYEKELKEQAAQEKEMAPVQAKMTAMSTAMREKKWDEAMDDLAAVEKLIPENRRDSMTVTLEVNRFRILLGKKDYPAAYKLAAKISDAHKNSAALQNYLAWQIVADKTIEKPDLELAETLANRANEAAKGQDPGILDTQARVLFLKGQKDEAIKTQARAVALAEPDGKQALQLTLDSYKKGELPVVN